MCLGLGLAALVSGCAADVDADAASEEALAASTCGLDPSSPSSPRRLLDHPITSPDDAATRLGCLRSMLRTQRDRRAPFASLYTDITVAVRAGIRAGRFEDAAWVAEYLTAFAELYRVAYVGYVDGDTIPGSWQIAFDAARGGQDLVVQDVALGVNAHVDRDLAHALVRVGIGRSGAERASRQHDHFRVNDILHENVDASLASLASTYARGLGDAPPALMTLLGEAYFRAVEAGRFKAWLDAVALADAGPFRRWMVEGEIELSSKLIAQAILAPNLDPGLVAKLRAVEAGP